MSILLLLACLSPVPVEVLTDSDGDGFYSEPGPDQDCDDENPDIFPGAEEICDYVDNNCDGSVDELGLTLWFPDVDGDGYGVEAGGQDDCSPGEGWSPTPGDCQDSDAAINPDADEVCDGMDNDCDGSIDIDAIDALTWYEDVDQDGYGAPETESLACEPPTENSTAESGDCDDTTPLVFPGGEEFCDGLDNDCDGEIDVGASDATAYYSDLDGDEYGAGEPWMLCEQAEGTVLDNSDCDDTSDVTFPGVAVNEDSKDCMEDADGDGYGDLLPSDGVTPGSDCNDADAAINPSALEVEVDGVDGNCDGLELCYIDQDVDSFGSSTLVETTDLTCLGTGFSAVDTDCDDTRSDTYPGATENVADGFDNDCDGLELCYTDSDGDSYGSTSTTSSSDTDCTGTGEADNADDCNDSDAAISPDGSELPADSVDSDCDSTELCYVDSDGDTYGSSSTVSSSDLVCTDTGEADNDDDCDDDDASVSPAGTEVAADGVDSDCDSSELCYVDSDGDAYGSTSTTTSTDLVCTDSGEADNADDCNDGDADISPDGTEVAADGVDSDCDTTELCYQDNDADTYGSTSTVSSSDLVCTGSGEADNDDDCDDGNASISPAGSEVAADGVDGDCDGGELCYVDSDGDDYGSTSTTASTDLDCSDSGEADNTDDCDDADADISPDGTEVAADGVDSDCDTNELCFVDSDGDSYGTSSTVTSSDLVCTGSGEADNDDDCDDASASISPAATEVAADGVDSDCDTEELCYVDSDGDDYGSTSTTGSKDLDCTDSGESDNSDDCDDGDSGISPDATERPADGVDSDCDTTELCYVDADGDTFGVSTTVSSADLDCNGSGESELDTDCEDTVATAYPGATEICDDGVDNDCDGLTTSCGPYGDFGESGGDYILTGSNNNYGLGTALATGDFDNDGTPDIWIGARYADENKTDNGSAYLLLGAITSNLTVQSSDDASLKGNTKNGNFARRLRVGDLNGDGKDDLVVHGYNASVDSSSSSGLVFVYYGPITSDINKADDKNKADAWAHGEDDYDYFGYGMTIGDIDDDGTEDLLVGSPYHYDNSSYEGAAYVFLGGVSGNDLSPDYTWDGGASNSYTGMAMISDDFDGDGIDDWVVGGERASSWDGIAYVVYGGVSADGDWSSDADVTLSGSGSGGAGRSFAAGDFDGDGSTDLVVGAPYSSTYKGAAYVLTGTLSTGTLSSVASSTFTGAGNYDYASWSMDAGCDIDADGLDDLLIGSPESNDGGYGYLILGGWSTGSLSLSSDYDAEISGGGDDEMGTEMLCVPDMDGNGADEFLVSAPWDGTDKGKVLLFMGGGD